MVRRAHVQGFEILTIHDSFWCLPNHVQKMRQNYLDILIEIADSDLLSNILSEIVGEPIEVIKRSNDLAQAMQTAEYALS